MNNRKVEIAEQNIIKGIRDLFDELLKTEHMNEQEVRDMVSNTCSSLAWDYFLVVQRKQNGGAE